MTTFIEACIGITVSTKYRTAPMTLRMMITSMIDTFLLSQRGPHPFESCRIAVGGLPDSIFGISLEDGEKQTCSGRRSSRMGKNKLVRGIEARGWGKTNLFGASKLEDGEKQTCSGRRSLRMGKNKLVRGVEALGSPRISFSEVPRPSVGQTRVSLIIFSEKSSGIGNSA